MRMTIRHQTWLDGCGGWVRPGVRPVFHPVRVQHDKVAVGGGTATTPIAGVWHGGFGARPTLGRPRYPPAGSRAGAAGGTYSSTAFWTVFRLLKPVG
jgi:hypothetical protein